MHQKVRTHSGVLNVPSFAMLFCGASCVCGNVAGARGQKRLKPATKYKNRRTPLYTDRFIMLLRIFCAVYVDSGA